MTPSRGQLPSGGMPVSLHRDYLVAPARQPGTSEQAGGACPDDGYSHGRTCFRYAGFDILEMH